MHNLLILGSGRSGTSLAASLFRNNPGVFYGHELIEARPANPYGYFEDRILNSVNDLIIRSMLRSRWADALPLRLVQKCPPLPIPPYHLDGRALWLLAPRRLRRCEVGVSIRRMMRCYGKEGTHEPFVYKDPRFSVTLPLWRSYLPANTRFLVVFRDPDRTIESILRDASETYTLPLRVTPRWLFTHWRRTYETILQDLCRDGKWLLVDFDQILSGQATEAIKNFANADVDVSRIDPAASRAKGQHLYEFRAARQSRELYRRLKQRSQSDCDLWS